MAKRKRQIKNALHKSKKKKYNEKRELKWENAYRNAEQNKTE